MSIHSTVTAAHVQICNRSLQLVGLLSSTHEIVLLMQNNYIIAFICVVGGHSSNN